MKIPAAKKAIFTSVAIGISIGSVTLAVAVGEQEISPSESSISYKFDSQYTHVKAFVVGEKYQGIPAPLGKHPDRKSTRLNSSHANISYAVFCLKKKNT